MDYKQLYEKILFEIYQLKQELKPMLTCLTSNNYVKCTCGEWIQNETVCDNCHILFSSNSNNIKYDERNNI